MGGSAGAFGELSIVSCQYVGFLVIYYVLKIYFMFLQLAHTKLNVYNTSQDLVLECYSITRIFPPEEKFVMMQQIRRASLSVHLNIAEGCSRKTAAERNRFFEIARGSVVEIDAALDIAVRLKYVSENNLNLCGKKIISTFKLLSGMIIK